MGNFVKLTTLGEDGSYTRTWIEQASIKRIVSEWINTSWR